jgi:hypothetical protein
MVLLTNLEAALGLERVAGAHHGATSRESSGARAFRRESAGWWKAGAANRPGSPWVFGLIAVA